MSFLVTYKMRCIIHIIFIQCPQIVQLHAQVPSQFSFHVLKGDKTHIDYLGHFFSFQQKWVSKNHSEGNLDDIHTNICVTYLVITLPVCNVYLVSLFKIKSFKEPGNRISPRK